MFDRKAGGTVFAHWSKYDQKWRWPNFTPEEMACKGDGSLMIHAGSMDKLQALRTAIAAPMVIHSAYRDREYNTRVGGADGSMHLCARAFDVSMQHHDPHEFETAARAAGFTGFGFYPRQNFMHIDTGPSRWWGEKFPAFEDETTPEAEAKREEVIDDLASMFGRNCSNPLKRKRALLA